MRFASRPGVQNVGGWVTESSLAPGSAVSRNIPFLSGQRIVSPSPMSGMSQVTHSRIPMSPGSLVNPYGITQTPLAFERTLARPLGVPPSMEAPTGAFITPQWGQLLGTAA